MSLDVSPQLLAEAENGEVREQDFVETVRTSLPYAYDLIARLAEELRSTTAEFARQPDAAGLREGARPAAARPVQRRHPRQPGGHFGITLAFQNCHRVAAFHPEALGGAIHTRFTSLRAQILNQSPEFRDC